jgi:hypothetical protein
MSSLLKEAIVDAKALRESALKNAEAAIVEKYSDEVRKTLDQLLEQEEDIFTGAAPEEAPAEGLDPLEEGPEADEELAKNIPLAATDDLNKADGSNLSSTIDSGENVEFNVDLDALQEAVKNLEDELSESDEIDIDEALLVGVLSEDDNEDAAAGGDEVSGETAASTEDEGDDEAAKTQAAGEQDKASGYGGTDESVEFSDDLVDSIVEKLTVDMGAELSGWAGRGEYDKKWEMEKELAHRRSTDLEEELENLKKAQEELVFENRQLKEQIEQYKEATNELKEGLQDVNLSNARLLYTNRVLRNTSLNERQKDKIVEAISKAGSVIEARTIFDTLQSTAQSTPKRGPQSLSEAITHRSSIIRASRKESTSSDPFQERMKRLAGIK